MHHPPTTPLPLHTPKYTRNHKKAIKWLTRNGSPDGKPHEDVSLSKLIPMAKHIHDKQIPLPYHIEMAFNTVIKLRAQALKRGRKSDKGVEEEGMGREEVDLETMRECLEVLRSVRSTGVVGRKPLARKSSSSAGKAQLEGSEDLDEFAKDEDDAYVLPEDTDSAHEALADSEDGFLVTINHPQPSISPMRESFGKVEEGGNRDEEDADAMEDSWIEVKKPTKTKNLEKSNMNLAPAQTTGELAASSKEVTGSSKKSIVADTGRPRAKDGQPKHKGKWQEDAYESRDKNGCYRDLEVWGRRP
ncbi:MAG: hypothetical protein Q9186_004924 [Xanthomendoza sp. 1 TL-2023]